MNGLVIDERADGGSPVHTLEAMGTGLQWVPASWGSAWLHLSGGGDLPAHMCAQEAPPFTVAPQTLKPGAQECMVSVRLQGGLLAQSSMQNGGLTRSLSNPAQEPRVG